MLSIAKLSPGQEAYYESSVAQGLDDYYAGRGESPGVWHGAGASRLGLVGVVADGDLGRLMRGVDPATQNQLRAAVSVRRIRVEQLDATTGERRLRRAGVAAGGGVRSRVQRAEERQPAARTRR